MAHVEIVRSTDPAHKVVNIRRPKTWILWVGLLAWLSGGVPFVFLSVWPAWNTWTASDWVRTPCQVQQAKVEVYEDSEGDTYGVQVRYSYEYAGFSYQGDVYDFSVGSSSGREEKERAVSALQTGQQYCFVDPGHPEVSVIRRELPGMALFGSIPLVFILGGIALAVTRFVDLRQQPKSPPRQDAALRPPANFSPLSKAAGGATASALTTALATALLVYAFPRVQDDTLPFYFLAVGAALGAFALLGWTGTFYYGLAALNPRVTLSFDEPVLRVGQPNALRWRTTGRWTAIKRLTLTLVGRERATYDAGSSSSTDTHEFARKELLNSGNSALIHVGSVDLLLPATVMHSFSSKNNVVEWHLELSGEISAWPDIQETIPLLVLPPSTKDAGVA